MDPRDNWTAEQWRQATERASVPWDWRPRRPRVHEDDVVVWELPGLEQLRRDSRV
jgi:hypothetical protein